MEMSKEISKKAKMSYFSSFFLYKIRELEGRKGSAQGVDSSGRGEEVRKC
jgi:hypothetical protein